MPLFNLQRRSMYNNNLFLSKNLVTKQYIQIAALCQMYIK